MRTVHAAAPPPVPAGLEVAAPAFPMPDWGVGRWRVENVVDHVAQQGVLIECAGELAVGPWAEPIRRIEQCVDEALAIKEARHRSDRCRRCIAQCCRCGVKPRP